MVSLKWKNIWHSSKHSRILSLSFIYFSLICSFGHLPTHSLNLLILTSLIISFQRFSTPPTIFVTASHQVPKRPQDAMAVWVEELRVDNFKICLREAKIFDGPHKGIKIVSKSQFRFLSVVTLINYALPKNCISSKLNENHDDPWLKSSNLKYLHALRCSKYIRGQLPMWRTW